ncbi:GyrI-like domain-containing protein [Variovorax sp. PCZ-1]|uniref:GyrI-like domain-containing protein n=1 Tax=Variovorax sp. PCZ-1 TaxID=2835533 RepID=UPI001BCEEBF0|nr:GyrI-like domain-containing protein [Variovorax sp. PCZ-1]MBS7807075.1 GyrI-like domain-containing protein [Variovorax sp. PCZ-1]
MSPEVKEFSAFAVQGLQVRTTNAAEQTAEAKIGALWGRYFSSPGAGASAVYGVYSGYEGDWTGAFDAMAGNEVAMGAAPQEGRVIVQVQGGQYLVFRAKGAMPQAVIEAWGRVWQYFSALRTDWQRCYATDFEQYLSADEVAVCIGVKPV